HQERRARTGDRQAQVRKGRTSRRGLQEAAHSTPARAFQGAGGDRQVIHHNPFLRLGPAGLAIIFAAAAQTLEQAESFGETFGYNDANEVFKALVSKYPDNPDYRVRWGRMFHEHWAPDTAQELYAEALGIKPNHAGAWLGVALLKADAYDPTAAEAAKKALEADPKLVEAQELLARLALEDNNNAKATEEAKKALALNPDSIQGKAILASIDLLADKKDSQWDPHDARGYETIGHFFTLNRRYDEGIAYYEKAIQIDPQLYSARSQLGVNLMRMGRPVEAREQLLICYNNEYRDH